MQVVVTGSAGRIGRVVARTLAEAGHAVRGLDLAFADAEQVPGVDQRVVDLLDRGRVFDHLADADAVVHLGNHPNEWSVAPAIRVYTENVAMTAHVFEAAIAQGCRKIVYVSSVQTMGSTRTLADDPLHKSHIPSLPLTGDTPAQPTNLYGLSKQAGEALLQLHTRRHADLAAVAVRLPYVGGTPGQPFGRDVEAARHDRWARHHSADEGFAYLPAADASRLLLTLLDRMTPSYDSIFPSADDNLFGLDAETIARDFFPGTEVQADLAGRFSVVDTTAITQRYGWAPTPIDRHQPAAATT